MKIFSTIALKFRLLVFLGFLVSTFVSVSAGDYKPMIRYDRVWECVCLQDKDGSAVVKSIRFDGEEEINGKVYHRLVTFKKSFPIYHMDTQTITYETTDCLEPEGYMREEDGVVYTLVAERQVGTSSNGEPYYDGEPYTSEEDDLDDIECREYVIYDFNVKEGDMYSGLTYIEMYSAGLNTFKVLNLSTVEIEGEECRQMYVCTEDYVEYLETYNIPYYWCEPIVEGVGAVDHGCLNYNEFITRPSRMYSHHYFSCLLDMEGNVIYPLGYEDDPNSVDYGFFRTLDILAPIYDMMGRRISRPAPGQLYIQGGKKKIAPRN